MIVGTAGGQALEAQPRHTLEKSPGPPSGSSAVIGHQIRQLSGYTSCVFRPACGDLDRSVIETAKSLGLATILDVDPSKGNWFGAPQRVSPAGEDASDLTAAVGPSEELLTWNPRGPALLLRWHGVHRVQRRALEQAWPAPAGVSQWPCQRRGALALPERRPLDRPCRPAGCSTSLGSRPLPCSCPHPSAGGYASRQRTVSASGNRRYRLSAACGSVGAYSLEPDGAVPARLARTVVIVCLLQRGRTPRRCQLREPSELSSGCCPGPQLRGRRRLA